MTVSDVITDRFYSSWQGCIIRVNWLSRKYFFVVKKSLKLFICLVIFVNIYLMPSNSFAYRPFVSTDASVAQKDKFELELGVFQLRHQDKENELVVPSARINYGVIKNWELVGESEIQIYKEGEGRNFEVKDPAVSLKGILHEGILQGKDGPSLSIELSALVPSTVKGERNTGVSGVGILAYKFSNLVYHINAGMELDRSGVGPNAIWGVILEYPFEGEFRVVGEINGVVKNEGLPETSGLVGFIWKINGIDLDFGARKGFSDVASDWELTSGMTLYF